MAVTGFLSTMLILGLAQLGRNAERRNLLKNGCRVQGKVISIERIPKSAKTPPTLRYQFIPIGQAEPVIGQCIVNLFSPYKPGDEAIICYNRAHPVSSIILSPDGRPL